MPGLAYSRGEDTTPLLRETIGQNLESMVARFPDRDALVSVHQGISQTYRAFDESVDLLAMGCCASDSKSVTGWASGARTARSGYGCSTPPPRSG